MTNDRFSSITSGRTAAHADFGDLHAIETRHAPRLRLPEHEHEDPTLNVTFEGGFEETLGSRRLDNRPGTVVAKPGGTGHANRYGAIETGSLLLQAPVRSLDRLGGLARVFARQVTLDHSSFRDLALAAVQYLREPGMIESAEAVVFELVYRVAHADHKSERPPRACLLRVRDALAERATGAVRVGALACAEGLSPSALSQGFRTAFGITPLGFVRQRRVEWARAALHDDPYQSLARLAIHAGFADQPHFTLHPRLSQRDRPLDLDQHRHRQPRSLWRPRAGRRSPTRRPHGAQAGRPGASRRNVGHAARDLAQDDGRLEAVPRRQHSRSETADRRSAAMIAATACRSASICSIHCDHK